MGKISVKTDFEKIIFESPHKSKFCDFLLDFGNDTFHQISHFIFQAEEEFSKIFQICAQLSEKSSQPIILKFLSDVGTT